MNCLGIVSRDSGQTRVPAPPHMMTGCIFFVIEASRRPSAASADSALGRDHTSFVTKFATHAFVGGGTRARIGFGRGQSLHVLSMPLRNGSGFAGGAIDVDMG